MDITTTKTVSVQNSNQTLTSAKTQNNESKVSFAEELKNVEKTDKTKESDAKLKKEQDNKAKEEKETKEAKEQADKQVNDKQNDENVDEAIDGLNTVLDELNKLNQKDEKEEESIKLNQDFSDINKRREIENYMLDNNMNIPEQSEKINLQTGTNTNFNNNGQPFSEFINSEKTKDTIKASAKELEEEKAILSTMEENMAIANKNMALSKTKTVENEHGVQKYDNKTNLLVDTIVSYDKVIMDKADVDFFTNLVDKGVIDMSEVQGAEKSAKVSKTLADMLAKAMNENKPVRIDFDNNISVIIKIDRAGKISADFLPSSQVAEAYLKENLPLLKQRFDDNNIDYNELNQRKQKQDTEDNKKKGRKDE